MNKLELYIVEFLQYAIMSHTLDSSKLCNRYIELEAELIRLTKGEDERELYLTTECNIHNMETPLFRVVRILDNHYKLEWKELFLYLIGAIPEVKTTQISNEMRMLRLSNQPLTNYLKSR